MNRVAFSNHVERFTIDDDPDGFAHDAMVPLAVGIGHDEGRAAGEPFEDERWRRRPP
jgi:hypothetical protein